MPERPKRIAIGIAFLLVASVAGGWAALALLDARTADSGERGRAEVLDRMRQGSARSGHYELRIAWSDGTGARHEATRNVTRSTYDRHKPGSSIEVAWRPESPMDAVIVADAGVAAPVAVAAMSALFGVVGLLLLLWRRVDG